MKKLWIVPILMAVMASCVPAQAGDQIAVTGDEDLSTIGWTVDMAGFKVGAAMQLGIDPDGTNYVDLGSANFGVVAEYQVELNENVTLFGAGRAFVYQVDPKDDRDTDKTTGEFLGGVDMKIHTGKTYATYLRAAYVFPEDPNPQNRERFTLGLVFRR